MIFNLKMFDTNKNIIVNESEGYESVLNHSHDFIEITFIFRLFSIAKELKNISKHLFEAQ